jgi:hypothetical protein
MEDLCECAPVRGVVQSKLCLMMGEGDMYNDNMMLSLADHNDMCVAQVCGVGQRMGGTMSRGIHSYTLPPLHPRPWSAKKSDGQEQCASYVQRGHLMKGDPSV